MDIQYHQEKAHAAHDYRHPQQIMQVLGIKYARMEKFPGGLWLFFDVQGDTDNLLDHLVLKRKEGAYNG